jgi:S1-C subfamily serine protease
MSVYLRPILAATLLGAVALTPAFAQKDSDSRGNASRNNASKSQTGNRSQSQRQGQRPDQASRQGQQNRRQVSGEIVKTKRVDVRNSDRQHLVALLKTDDGNRLIVDLGSPGRLGDQMPKIGDQISATGRSARVGDRTIIVADQLRNGDQTVRIDHSGWMQRRSQPASRQHGQQDRQQGDRSNQQDDRRQAQLPDAFLGLAFAHNPQTGRLHVMRVYRNSPADRAGIQPGDMILLVDNKNVTSARQLFQTLAAMMPGQQVGIVVSRDGQQRETQAELTSRDEFAQSESRAHGQQRERQDDRQVRGQNESASEQ